MSRHHKNIQGQLLCNLSGNSDGFFASKNANNLGEPSKTDDREMPKQRNILGYFKRN